MIVVDHIEVKPGNIRLLMMFNDQKVDVSVDTWTQLKKDYENDNPLKLEEFLFFRMVHLMKVQAEQTILEIFDKNRNSSFYSEIYMENDELKIESSFLKSVKKDIVIEKVDYIGMTYVFIARDPDISHFEQKHMPASPCPFLPVFCRRVLALPGEESHAYI